MPSNKTNELFDMSTSDLYEELGKAQQELMNLRFQFATHQNTNYATISAMKWQVARVKTILHERELEESQA